MQKQRRTFETSGPVQGKARDSFCKEYRCLPPEPCVHISVYTALQSDFNPSNFLVSHSSSTWQLSLSLIRVDPTYSTSPFSPLVFAFVTYGLYLKDRSVPTG